MPRALVVIPRGKARKQSAILRQPAWQGAYLRDRRHNPRARGMGKRLSVRGTRRHCVIEAVAAEVVSGRSHAAVYHSSKVVFYERVKLGCEIIGGLKFYFSRPPEDINKTKQADTAMNSVTKRSRLLMHKVQTVWRNTIWRVSLAACSLGSFRGEAYV